MPFVLATYNVKDLFDPTDEPSRAHVDAKLADLARHLARANADVVALQEVGSAAVVQALRARLPQLGYGEPIVGTFDKRGIGCAILARVPVRASRVHTTEALDFPVFAVGDAPPFGARMPLRRGIVHVEVDAGALGPIDVLAGHFKSNRALPIKDAAGEEVPPTTERQYAEGQLRSLVWRGAEALFVRGLVDQVRAADPTRHVIVAGDLNDPPGGIVVRVLCGGGDHALVPCADAVPEAARFSILYKAMKQQIDHVLVTRGLRERLTSACFFNEELRDHGEFEYEAKLPDSDHAAMVVTFA